CCFGREDPLSRCGGWSLAYFVPDAGRFGKSERRSRTESARHTRRVFYEHGLSHECKRSQSRDADRRDGTSGEVSATDDTRLRLRGELRAPEPRTADGRDQSNVPRVIVMDEPKTAENTPLETT